MIMPSYESPDLAEAAYYRAFEHCDPTAMAAVWSGEDQDGCIHPGGPLLQGSEAVQQSWQHIFSQASPPEVSYRVLQRQTSADLAVHMVEESIRPAGGSEPPTRVMALNIYRRSDDGWHMTTHHASLPMMGQPKARGPMH
jgi:ketosteroid isomerase-like protein